MPNDSAFRLLTGEAIEKARGGGKYARVRRWGEIVNTFYVRANARLPQER